MLPGPVFTFELLSMSRRKVYYLTRFLYGFLLLFLISQSAPGYLHLFDGGETPELTIQQLAQIGSWMFSTFAWTQAVIVLLITPALVAGTIADEKQRKTLHYLLTSRLTSAEIVLGKLFARMLGLGVLLAVGLPILTLLSLFGGVDPNGVILFIGACFTTAFFLGSLAILVSVHAKRPRDAVSLVYLLEVAWLFGPAFLKASFSAAGGFWAVLYPWIQPVNEWVGASSPLFVLMNSAMRGFRGGAAGLGDGLWMAGLQVAYGLVFVALALFRLRPAYRAANSGPGRLSLRIARRAQRFLPRPPCGEDGLLWKERYVSRTGPAVKLIGGLIALVVVGFVGYWTIDAAWPALGELRTNGYGGTFGPSRSYLNGFLRTVMTLFYVCWLLATASAASAAITQEREEDTWISLISSPVTAFEVVRAKLFGAFWLPKLAGAVWAVLLLVGLVCGAIHPVGALGATLYAAVTVAFCDALGVYLSLVSKNSGRSLTGTIALLILFNVGYLLLCIPFGVEHALWLVGVMPFNSAMSLASYDDIRDLLGTTGANGFSEQDVTATVVISALIYTLGTAVLYFRLLDRFDDVHDRPRTDGRGRGPRARPEPKAVEKPAMVGEEVA